MKRYASHLLFFPAYGYVEQYAIEMREGQVVRIFPLEEEIESTEWLPGIIVLLSNEDDGIPDFDNCCRRLDATPLEIEEKLSSLFPVLFFPFDFTTMSPGVETRRIPLR